MKSNLKLFLSFIFYIFFIQNGDSQITFDESLKAKLHSAKEDTNKVNLLLKLNESCIDCDSNIFYIEIAFGLSEKLNYPEGKANVLLAKGNYFENQGEFSDALDNITDAIEIGKAIGNKKIVAQGFNNLGRIKYNLGDWPIALENFSQALKLFEETNYQKGVAASLNNIAVLYRVQHEDSLALKYNLESLKIRQVIDDKKGIAESYQNIANCFDPEKDFDLMMKYYQQSITIRDSINDKSGIAHTLNNIGLLYLRKNDFTTALSYFNKSLLLFEELGFKKGISFVLYDIGLVYFENKDMKNAEKYILRSLEIAEKYEFTERTKYASLKLSQIYAGNKDFIKAFEMQSIAGVMERKLNSAEVQKTLAKYEFDKREAGLRAEQDQKDLKANYALERQKAMRNWIIGASLLFISASGIIIFFYKRRREAEIQLEISASRMKAINAQLNQHFIFSSLSSIRSYMSVNFETADDYLVRFAKFVRSILNHSDANTISLKQELDETENYMILEQFRFSNKFDYTIHIEKNIDPEEFIVPPLLFQPIVENSIKHGFEGIEYKGMININIKLSGDKLICELSDNGKGFEKSQDTMNLKRKSFGTKLTIERISIFNKISNQQANYQIESLEQGVKTTIYLPAVI